MITRKNFLLGTLGAAGVAACGDDGAGGAGGTSSTSGSGATTKASVSAAGSGSTKATSASTSNGASTTTNGTSNSTTGGGMFDCADPGALIGTNHPAGMEHTLTVPAADIAAGAEKTYDITGNSQHMHAITVTAADFTTLKTTGTVSVTSTSGGMHTHVVTVTCAD